MWEYETRCIEAFARQATVDISTSINTVRSSTERYTVSFHDLENEVLVQFIGK